MTEKIKPLAIFLLCALLSTSCVENDQYKATLEDRELFHSSMKQLTDVMVHDIFSPPVASRVYVYPSVAAYEVLAVNADELVPLGGQLNGLDPAPTAKSNEVNLNLAAIHAFLKMAHRLIFSEEKIETYREQLFERLADEGLPRSIKKASMAYGSQVADHILAWANNDNYHQTRTFPQYTVRNEAQYWKPTPPDYMNGIEPHWNKIRTMILDSARQFKPKEPEEFSIEEGGPFYTQLKEVYEVVNNLNEEQTDIAKFWDCNPYVSHHYGHAMFATKKITPGGHWIGITAIATRMAESDFDETVEAYAKVSIALFDTFISCWDEKWRTIVVRPETIINQYMDQEWSPLLQTPPFPEYTSGHSVISRAAAVALTDMYGDNFAFNDTTEVEYGLGDRRFQSFLHASEEAAISRLYGGIHYRMAIENGVEQGHKVGEYIISKIQTRNTNEKVEKEVVSH